MQIKKQISILLVALTVLLVNVGLMPAAWAGYQPNLNTYTTTVASAEKYQELQSSQQEQEYQQSKQDSQQKQKDNQQTKQNNQQSQTEQNFVPNTDQYQQGNQQQERSGDYNHKD